MREMTDDERELEQKRLAAKIVPFLGRAMNGRTVERIEEIVADHRIRVRLRGLDFPKCAVIVLPLQGNVEIVPAELEREQIEVLIVNLVKKWPTTSANELGFAINRAFPGYAKMVGAAAKHEGWTPH